MAFDETLAGRLRETLGSRPEVTEVRMFGGLVWLAHGNMAVAVRSKGGLRITNYLSVHDYREKPGQRALAALRVRRPPDDGFLAQDRPLPTN